MKDYSSAKIYKIVGGNKTYYGSTLQPLHKRFCQHKSHKKRFDTGMSSAYCSSYDILNEPDCGIFLVEALPACKNRDELNARERYHVENNECINKNIPARTSNEWETINFEKRTQQRQILQAKKHITPWICDVCNIKLTESTKKYHINNDKIHLSLCK